MDSATSACPHSSAACQPDLDAQAVTASSIRFVILISEFKVFDKVRLENHILIDMPRPETQIF